MGGRADPVSLVGGLVIAALGGLVLLDASGGAEIAWGWFAAAAAATIGTLLLVWGLAARAAR